MIRIAPTIAVALCCLASPLYAQQTSLTDAHLRSADLEVPRLLDVLQLKPGMAVADVGAGFGAWTRELARVLGPKSRVYSTEIAAPQLAALRQLVEREGLSNVTVVEGTPTSANLPAGCCDAVLIRDVYHHVSHPEEMVRSVVAALKPGGRLAVIDFPPRPNTEVPAGVPADRRGHGVPPEIVEREFAAGLTHVRTTLMWSPESQPASLYLVLFEKR